MYPLPVCLVLCVLVPVNQHLVRSESALSTLTTFPIGIIRISDRSDRLQCTQNHKGGEKKHQKGNFFLSFPDSPLQTMFKSNTYLHQTAVDSPYCAGNHGSERMNENKQRGKGKIKIQKYIFICLYLYIFIYLRGMYPQKKKTPKFQNRQSVFFQMCPCLQCLKKT